MALLEVKDLEVNYGLIKAIKGINGISGDEKFAVKIVFDDKAAVFFGPRKVFVPL